MRRELTHGGDTLVTGGDGGGRGRGQQAGEGEEELHGGLWRLKSAHAKPAGSFIGTFYLLFHVTQQPVGEYTTQCAPALAVSFNQELS